MIRGHWQTVLFAVAGLGMVVLHTLTQPDLPAQVLMLAPLVAVLGLPHGALDLPIAEALWPLTGWRRKLLFTALYLGLAGSVIALWLLWPGVALAIFLAYSALHFSGDWMRAPPLLRWTGGAATIGAPALVHHGEVEELFAVLAPQDAAAVIADVAALIGALALAGVILSVFLLRRARGAAALEQAILWITAAAVPPLMYFVVYFCALHSVRHFTGTIRVTPDVQRALVVALMLSGAVTVAAIMVLLYGSMAHVVDIHDQVIRIVFIGLAALTVPHMILVDRFLRTV